MTALISYATLMTIVGIVYYLIKFDDTNLFVAVKIGTIVFCLNFFLPLLVLYFVRRTDELKDAGKKDSANNGSSNNR